MSSEINKIYGYDFLFKVILVGATGVGKSSLLSRFIDKESDDPTTTTIGIDYKTKQITTRNKDVRLLIYDLSGQDRFLSLGNLYYRTCQGVIFVYDISRRETFDNIESWISEIEQYVQPGTQKILIGMKNDLEAEREVPFSEGREFAKRNGMRFFENSSRNSNQIEVPFLYLTNKILLARDDVKTMFLMQKLEKKKKEEKLKTRECFDFVTWITHKFDIF